MIRRIRSARADQRGGISVEYAIIFAVSVTLATVVGGLVVTRAETIVKHSRAAVEAECSNRYGGEWADDSGSCVFTIEPGDCWDTTTRTFRSCTDAETDGFEEYLQRVTALPG